jgi:hypothetical protein
MTILALDTSVISDLSTVLKSKGPLNPSSNGAQTALHAIPRINLRKRPFAVKKVNLESVNSAFFDGLFADVAKANEGSSCQDPSSLPKPHKKTRLNKESIMSRCGRSFKILTEALDISTAGVPIPESPNQAATNLFPSSSAFPPRHEDSLQFQLHCVSSCTDVYSAPSVAFPHLPPTVSDSSYSASSSKLTRVISDLQSSGAENKNQTNNDTYGWFVEMEDESTEAAADAAASSALAKAIPSVGCPNTPNLAFIAPTAPKAENYDAELEWAAAADTVDDVLGDFF